MMRRTRRRLRRFARQERGATLALTAVMIGSVTALLALAIDLGYLYVARALAQRAADGAALAGASAFLDFVPAETAVQPAQDRAYEFALKNHVLRELIDSSQVMVRVNPDSQTVAVRIERRGIGMFFARLLGIAEKDVSALAVAWASSASLARCIAPLAFPDWWGEAHGDPEQEDADLNQVWDENESWAFDPDDGDAYVRYGDADSPDPGTWTGLGSNYRDGSPDAHGNAYTQDWGRPMVLKPQGPQDPHTPHPGCFFPINLDGEPDGGAREYRDAFTNCSEDQQVSIGDTLVVENGNMVGPTRFAVQDVIDLDPAGVPDGYWENPEAFGGQALAKNSPRTLAIVMISPIEFQQMVISHQGNASFTVHDIALFYIEGMRDLPGNNDDAVIGRFLEYASGGASGSGPSGSLIRTTQLIR